MKDEVKYYEQMKSSIIDKFRLIDHLVGETVLEIGFGGGGLTMEMLYNGYDVYGIDSSIISLQKAQAPMIKRQKEKMFLCDAFDAFKFFKGMKFDNIVLSSVLHEIFSYKRNEYIGYNKGNIGVANEVVKDKTIFLLKQLTYLLNDGGKILIRDGVGIEPDKSFNMCSIKLNEEEKEIFDIWYSKYNSTQNMYVYDDGILKMHKSNMMEFMYTLTWGKDGIDRESQETYGVFSGDQIIKLGDRIGMNVVHYEEYLQDGYKEFFEHLDFKDITAEHSMLPSSNQIVIYQK